MIISCLKCGVRLISDIATIRNNPRVYECSQCMCIFTQAELDKSYITNYPQEVNKPVYLHSDFYCVDEYNAAMKRPVISQKEVDACNLDMLAYRLQKSS